MLGSVWLSKDVGRKIEGSIFRATFFDRFRTYPKTFCRTLGRGFVNARLHNRHANRMVVGFMLDIGGIS